MAQGKFRNVILRHLDSAAIERLGLRPVSLDQGRALERPGEAIDELFFFEDGIGSMTTSFMDGTQVESGMYGWDSAIGTAALIGVPYCTNPIVVQVPGHGHIATRDVADREFRRYGEFHRLLLRSAHSQIVQAAQSAGCNARHNVQQRLSRWLLLCRDRVSVEVMPLTQEFLAIMLGVERPAVSVVAAKLQEDGMIEYSRGRVRIVDRDRLEKRACECYQVVRQEIEDFGRFADALQAS